MTHREILLKAFATMTDTQAKRVKFHLDLGTPILSGVSEAASTFVDRGRY